MYAIVLTTTASLKQARNLIQGLLKEQLIACGSILGPIESHFTWQGKLCVEKERQVFLKTKEKHFSKIEKYIIQHHSYEVPEIILISIKKGLKKYFNWMDHVTSPLLKKVHQ